MNSTCETKGRHALFRLGRSLVPALLLGAALAAPVIAQTYPNKPVRIIVPFGAGGGTDTLTRLLGQKMEGIFGQSVVVENRPGGGTIIGTQTLMKSAPDGYTLLITPSDATTVIPSLYKKPAYDPEKDLTPIAMVAKTPFLFVTSTAKPFKTFKELVQHAQANPGKINYGVGAISNQIVGAKVSMDLGIKTQVINYKSSAEAILSLLSGDVDFIIADVGSVTPNIKAGKFRGLAVADGRRLAALPDIPTMAEAGYPNMEYGFWYALYAPTNTPAAVIDTVSVALTKVLADGEFKSKLAELSLEPAYLKADALAARQRSEAKVWDAVIRSIGLSLD